MANVAECGQSYSFSKNACIIRFSGGPWDGREGLFDSEDSSISVIDRDDGIGYQYERAGSKHFALAGTWKAFAAPGGQP